MLIQWLVSVVNVRVYVCLEKKVALPLVHR